MWTWLTGKKTYLVMAAIGVCEVLKLAHPEWADALNSVIAWLAGAGGLSVVHRLSRGGL